MTTVKPADKTADVVTEPAVFDTDLNVILAPIFTGTKADVVSMLAQLSMNLESAKTALSTATAGLPEAKAFADAREALDKAIATLPDKANVDRLSALSMQFVTMAQMGRKDCADLTPPAPKLGRPKGSKNTPK